MSQGKKFGTFAGVFTPSILTILGVIMYMRLSWVVGNAGLVSAIAIILIAHIVSITTGLSVSSVATDRKIKAGGIYYMLSRSLGLPIGGSIGITLFVATALSIALYLIGFAESALVILQEPLGIENVTTNHIRIAGSVALFIIVSIAYISTTIAIKSQFFILGAIILSIISILLGTAEGKSFDLSRVDEIESSFFVLFGIFFPAVTGFTAGVAMSGDLKDPKKSIPWGTMLAVGVGLIVYLGLAIFIFYSFEDNLAAIISDKNALIKFGWIPALVIGGIWGATLSSALGGILGAPRILQAMSVDSITPKVFGKGVGVDNEPRNALILTFIIAEGGILIGELDVIAEVVAMFYLSAYLFINVSCMLEQWASPDFRPTFKIPLGVSLIGTIVTFVLMILLNLVAAVVAILLMTIIFIWLTRKQLVLGSGDVWQSVWSSVVKMGLKNLDKKSTHKRNWNPNILLFSGGTETRSKLIEFSKSVAGTKGMISNFDLIENKTAKLLFPKHKQSVKDDDLYSQGIFARKQECKDVYEGIEAISSTYGFSGVEPNTILAGWEQSSDEPVRFAQLTQKLCDLDYNVLYLDYDQQRGFGGMKSIDIWWSDFSNTTELTLNLAKFMSSSIDWRRAELRVLYVNNENDRKVQLEEVIVDLLSNYRINAKAKIINNEIEQKELYEIMKVESYDSDLVIVGIPDHLDDEDKFVEKTDELVKILGTTLLVRASSNFEEAEVEIEEENVSENFEQRIVNQEELKLDESLFGFKLLQNLTIFNKRNTAHISDKVLIEISDGYNLILNNLEKTIESNYDTISKQYSSNSTVNMTLLNKTFKNYIQSFSKELEAYNSNFLDKVEIDFSSAINSLFTQNDIYQSKLPRTVNRKIELEELEITELDSRNERRAKKWIKYKSKFGIKPQRKIKCRAFVKYYYSNYYLKLVRKTLNNSGIYTYKNSIILNEIADEIKKAYHKLREGGNFQKEEFEQFTKSILSKTNKAKSVIESNLNQIELSFDKMNNDYSYSLSKKINLLSINYEVDEKSEEKGKNEYKTQLKSLSSFPGYFVRNNRLINNAIILDISLHEIHPEIDSVIKEAVSLVLRIGIKPQVRMISQYNELDATLKDNDANTKLEIIKFFNKLPLFSFDIDELINSTIKKVEKIVFNLSNSLDIMDQESLNNFNEIQDSRVNTSTIQLQRLILFSVENKLIKVLNQQTDNLQNDLNILISNFKNKSLTVETLEFESETDAVNEIRKEILVQAETAVDSIETRFKNYVSKVNEELEDTYKLLDYDFIAGNSNEIHEYIRKSGTSTSRIKRMLQTSKREVKSRFKNTLSFVYKQRDEFLLSEYKNQHRDKININALVSGFTDKVIMPKSVSEAVPFFYRKLFISDHAAPMEIEHRDTEIEQAKKAIQQLSENSGGSILITGEQLSGKKYFADYVASRMLNRNLITIAPLIQNNTIVDSFEATCHESFGNENGIETNLIELDSSTIVFNDIDKWGVDMTVISRIKALIVEFGNKHNFIISCTVNYYSYLKKISDFDEVIISTILLMPVKREEFIQTFKLKHQAGGLKFVMNNKSENEFSERGLAKLYQKYHGLYKGNLGRAFLAWINNINAVEGNEIFIVEPKSLYFPDISNPDWIVLLRIFVLHREVSLSDIDKLCSNNFSTTAILNQMKRTRLIHETKKGVFELMPETYYFVESYLIDKKIID